MSFADCTRPFVLSALVLISTPWWAAGEDSDNWPRFRGHNGTGQGSASVPLRWSEVDVRWRRELPGLSYCSPVIWGDRLFVTSGDPDSAARTLAALDAHTGEVLWQRSYAFGSHSLHANNCYSSSSPAADAQHVYVVWASPDEFSVLALTHTGTEVWRCDFETGFQGNHGHGSSPIVENGLVYIANHHEGVSFVAALDAATGNVRWRYDRPPVPTKANYGTPCLAETPSGRSVLVTSSMAEGVLALDPLSGDVVWQVPDLFSMRCCSSPVWAGGLVLSTSGAGGGAEHLIAIRSGNSSADTEEVYRIPRRICYVPTPVVYNDLLFLWEDGGVVSCLDLATGNQHWRKRVGGNFLASPIVVDDRLYGVSVDGEVIVLAASKEFDELARCSLGERTHSTPSVAHDRLYFRTASAVLCIGE